MRQNSWYISAQLIINLPDCSYFPSPRPSCLQLPFYSVFVEDWGACLSPVPQLAISSKWVGEDKYTSSAGAVKSIDSKHVTSRRVFLHKNPSHGNGASTDKSFPKCLWKFPTEKAMRITRSEMGGNGRGENYF